MKVRAGLGPHSDHILPIFGSRTGDASPVRPINR